ncbi:MAG: ABC transporter permease, partial [Opitutales bacterium]|nr:ABC transporter permease [Opitutales bacterium]
MGESEKIQKESLWTKSFRKLLRDRLGVAAMIVVGIYAIVVIGVWAGVLGSNWSVLGEDGFQGMSARHWFGTNINGQDIFARAIQGTKTAFEVGLVVAISATAIGGILGAIAGYFNGTIIDDIIMWIYGCIDAIPFYLFVAAVGFALKDQPYAMHVAMIATFWSSTCRIVRGEVIKIRGLEYIQAAQAIGVKPITIIFRHILPNTFHILLVQSTIAFVGAIKSEVILTFLGLGVKDGVSWGTMLSESTNDVLRGHFGNFLSASGFLFILVIAFNMFADALQDALDP